MSQFIFYKLDNWSIKLIINQSMYHNSMLHSKTLLTRLYIHISYIHIQNLITNLLLHNSMVHYITLPLVFTYFIAYIIFHCFYWHLCPSSYFINLIINQSMYHNSMLPSTTLLTLIYILYCNYSLVFTYIFHIFIFKTW